MQHSSRLLGPFLHWLLPNASDNTLQTLILGIRKCAHLTEYAVLAVLCAMALKKENGLPGWSWRRARNALLIVLAYAITDELHQTFVPRRQGSWVDVLIDTSGGALGLLFLWVFGRWRRANKGLMRESGE